MQIEKKRDFILYIVITFLLTWTCWGILIFWQMPVKEKGNIISNLLYILGGMSTAIVALVMPLFSKRSDRSNYYKNFFRFTINVKWYIYSVISVMLLIFVSYGLVFIVFKKAATSSLSILPFYMLLPLFAGDIIGGGIEEFGWRGILVHNLRKNHPLLIAIIIGFIWFCWHIPLFFINGTLQYHTNFIPFFFFVISCSLVTTILYLITNSVISCILFHALINAFSDLGINYFGSKHQPLVSITFYSIVLIMSCAIFLLLNFNRTVKLYDKK